MFQKCICSTLTLLWFVAATVHASIFVPDGLNPGDEYQLAFVTQGTHDAISNDINIYNDFVQAQAALNSAQTGTDESVKWRAIASTSTTTARDNAPVTAPVFLMDGTMVATGFFDLWDGSLLSPIHLNQFVTAHTTRVWTGTYWDGTQAPAGWGLGYTGNTWETIGYSYMKSEGRWIKGGTANSEDWELPLYALSEKLTVPTQGGAVPEPASVVVWLGLASVLGVGVRLRRRLGRRV